MTEAVQKQTRLETGVAAGTPGVAAGAPGVAAVAPGAGTPAVGAPVAATGAAGPASGDVSGGPEVRRAHFQPLEPGAIAVGRDNISLLMDVVVTMTVELGGASLPLREVLALGSGSVVRLERALGEPVDILINRELVGRGEVVVVDDRFGVRVTELLDPKAEKP